jgi:transcriptional antiterminator
MIWQVSQFCKPKIGTKIECHLFYIRVFSGCGTIKSKFGSASPGRKVQKRQAGAQIMSLFQRNSKRNYQNRCFGFLQIAKSNRNAQKMPKRH